MTDTLKVTKIAESKISQVDFSNLAFGTVFTDHMFVCEYKNGKWQTPEILPYGPLQMDPSAKVFHYPGLKWLADALTKQDKWKSIL